MNWQLCRPNSPAVQDEAGHFIATFANVQLAESTIAMHNSFMRAMQTPIVRQDSNKCEKPAEAIALGWSRKVSW